MKFSRTDLLTMLISLFILNSCKNQDAIGLGVNSSNQVSAAMVDTSTIVVNTFPEDSVITSNLSKIPFGYFIDPALGTSQSDIATNLNLPGAAAYALPSGTITIDSVRLVLSFANGFYGDSIESVYKVNVYQLNERYINNSTYYNTKKWNYNSSNLLGSLTFNARTHDSIKIFNIITSAPDTLIKVAPQIRIPINPAFINNNLFSAEGTALNSNTIFQNNIRGLYLTIDKTKTTGSGGIFMIKADTLAVYYKAVNGATIDTGQAYMPITSLASAITHSYTPAVQSALNNTKSSNGTFYLQGLAGLKAKISFPALLQNLRNNLLKKDSDIVLNRAELVITPVAGSNIPYSPLPKISLYTLDIALQPKLVQDASPSDPRYGGVTVFGGFYAPYTKSYHFILTAFLQDLLSGKTVDYGTFIAPVDVTNTTSVDYLETPQVAARTIAVGTNQNSPYHITLNVIYTKIKKTN